MGVFQRYRQIRTARLESEKREEFEKELKSIGVRPSDNVVVHIHKVPKSSPGVAAVLSFLMPGLGQIYSGRVLSGFFWMLLVIAGYMAFIVPGLILHLFCVLRAYSGAKK